MAEPWRNRVFAPLYALVITFVLVFLTGAALPEPAQPPPRLTVTVQVNREQPDQRAPGAPGQKVPGAPDQRAPGAPTRICVTPPEGWAVEGPAPDPATGSVCVDARGEPVPIVLRKVP